MASIVSILDWMRSRSRKRQRWFRLRVSRGRGMLTGQVQESGELDLRMNDGHTELHIDVSPEEVRKLTQWLMRAYSMQGVQNVNTQPVPLFRTESRPDGTPDNT